MKTLMNIAGQDFLLTPAQTERLFELLDGVETLSSDYTKQSDGKYKTIKFISSEHTPLYEMNLTVKAMTTTEYEALRSIGIQKAST